MIEDDNKNNELEENPVEIEALKELNSLATGRKKNILNRSTRY